ncbi:ABC transporter substrate-binding protein [Tepidibacter thalassicus]|uniref:NitT/TauT family transport system substrate-binding protein n=1 Tax=Tepidibacter thalassicus DSM 15285 TaxID=1123350 RepID=A0A1M5RKX9_9FIRM|nr:ABC transporter substrate-binding protein [Tepidibacter thalassicus]SHH26885.1 NitT/TauT family transport system substrate-binding protein [Tepidibacter thalassicus DSM 15285]
MGRKILLSLILILSITVFGGCKQSGNKEVEVPKEEIKIVISGPKAPPTFPLLRMIETKALGENVKIDFKIWNGVEELLTIATNSEYGFLAVPVNTAAKLYNKGVDIKLTNVNTWGVMYLSTTDSKCNHWEDLKGKKLYVPFKSAPPDIVTQYFLEEYGLKVGKDVDIIYSTPSEIAQMVKAGEVEYAMNIEPFITASKMENEKLRVIFDYMKEWKKIKGSEYDIPNAGIVTNNKFLKEHKELVKLFEKEYEKALIWTLENPKEAAQLVEKYLGLNKDLIEKSMPTLGLKYKHSNNAKKDLKKYYETLLNFKADSIGGKIPNEDYYYEEK